MKRNLTKSAMLELWKTMRAGEPLRLDCTLTRTDGADYDRALEAEMRAWYLHLLDCGDESMLAPIEMGAAAEVSPGATGLAVVRAPEGVRRILRMRFEGWDGAIAPDADEATVRACAANPFCRRPLAARISPGAVIASGASGRLVELTCAMDFGEDSYVFDDKAIKSMIDYGA